MSMCLIVAYFLVRRVTPQTNMKLGLVWLSTQTGNRETAVQM